MLKTRYLFLNSLKIVQGVQDVDTRSNAQYGHYCTPQVLFINPEPGYSQDFSFPQDVHDFQQQYLCCGQCRGPHETFQCQQVIFYEPCCENYGGPHENFQCQPLTYCEPNPSYDSYYSGFDQFGDFHPQQYLCCENCGGPQETFHCQPPQYTINHPIFNAHNGLLSSQTTLMEQMTTLTSMCEMLCQIVQKKQEEKRIKEEQATNAQYWKIPACCDDDDDYNSGITPVLSTKEPVDSLSIPDTMCDVHFVNNPTPLETKDHFKSVIKSKDDISSSDDDSLYNENIEYVEASPHNSEVVSLEVAEIVILKDEEIKDDNLRKKLLNSSSTSPKSFLEETNTFHNSLPEFEDFCFDLEEITSGSTTTHSDISLSDYEAFYFDDNHIEEISSGSTTTHSNVSLSKYDSFIFDLLKDQFPPIDRSDFTHEEFADDLAHIISLPKYDCFYFRNLPDLGELISSLNSRIRENLSSTTCVYLLVEDDHSPLLAYIVWIFLAYLTYPVIPPYLHPFGNEDTIFDPGITINRFYSFKPGLSHRCGTFKKFNTHRSHWNEWPMIINGKNILILDVLLFHFYPP
nr:hypothetical protein [Tanacetum cinerariifolium]